MRNYYPTITNAIDLRFHYQIPTLVTISKTLSYFTNYTATVLIALVLTKNSKVQLLLSGFCKCPFSCDPCLHNF